MRIIADLHIHGPYSRATSRDTTIANLEKYARMKGVSLLGTGDFTHPEWMKALKSELAEDGSGILKTKSGFPFMLSTEVSNVYEQGGKVRKIHNVLHAPDLATAAQVNEFLGKKGNLRFDGRPTFSGMGCPELVEGLMQISGDIAVIPAHAWTPWFGIFGSKSGFDSVEECFSDQARHIFALETGMSSDPAMNWRLSSLDGYALVSNSDAHSYWPWRMGREANVFELPELTYGGIMDAVREKDKERFIGTVEVDPGYGKYHLDGHRECSVRLTPAQSAKAGNICPSCRKPLTIGVLHRIEELADRPEGYTPKGAIPFSITLPLGEIIAAAKGLGNPNARGVWEAYTKLIRRFGSEFSVLMDAPIEGIKEVADAKVSALVGLMREGKLAVEPGYDGVYGKLSAKDEEKSASRREEVAREKEPQRRLSGFF
jgi:uncharacterized protein (TIGR00375 family)